MRRPNHASRFEGIAKTNLQASRASDTETLQSQVNKAAKKRLSLSGLEILHGRLLSHCTRDSMLYCTNIRYGGIPRCIGSDHANLAGTGRCRLVRESRLFPWTRGACKSRRSDCPSPG